MLLIILKQTLKCLFILWTFPFILLLIYPKVIWGHNSTSSLTTKSPDISRMVNTAYENETNDTNAVQKTTCSIVSGDAQLRAEAIMMQMPQSPCSTQETEAMETALINLEKRLTQQLHGIKSMLVESIELASLCKCPTHSPPIHNTTDQNTKQYANYSNKNGRSRADGGVASTLEAHNGDRSTLPKLLKYQTTEASLSNRYLRKRYETPSMQQKNLRFDEHSSVFTYYWNLKNFTEHLKNGYSSVLDSPPFTIKGKHMNIKVFFRHLQRDFIYLQLCEAKKSKRDGIMLEANDSFQEIVNNINGNTFRYTISILNQNNADMLKDNNLISQEFQQLNSGLLIPNSALLESPYVKNNSILIQIIIYI